LEQNQLSYDLEVWSVHPPIPETHHDQAHKWQLVINSPDTVTTEDLPVAVIAALPEAKCLTLLNLEGVSPPEAQSFAMSIATALAGSCEGVVLDPQILMLWTPRGAQWLRPSVPTERVDLIEFFWCFMDGVFGKAYRASYSRSMARSAH
jgi:hypothetical protein